jgi:hypothetical protein
VAIGLYDSAFPTPNYAQVVLPLTVVAPGAAGVPDYTDLVTSEFQNSPDFLAVVNLLANGAGAAATLIDALPEYFDLDAAVGAQLDVVGQWVGISRSAFQLALQFFGFSDDISALPFGEVSNPSIGGVWYELGESIGGTAALPDAAYQLVLKAKIITNQYDGTLAELEDALTTLTGAEYQIIDPGTLTVPIVMLEPVSNVIEQLLTGFDFAPRAAGVNYAFMFPLTGESWGLIGAATESGGTTVTKTGGTVAYDSAAYVAGAFTQVSVSWELAYNNGNEALVGGLAAGISTPNYTALNYGIGVTGSVGLLTIYESGSVVGTFGAWAAGDTCQVVADGRYVTYLHNNQIIRSVAVAGGPFYPFFSLYYPESSAVNISIAID